MKKILSAVLVLVVFFSFFITNSQAETGEVKLAWDQVNEPDIAGYKIYYGQLSRFSDNFAGYDNVVDVGNVHNYDLTLPAGQWCFSVTAYDNAGQESDFSNEVSTFVRENMANPVYISDWGISGNGEIRQESSSYWGEDILVLDNYGNSGTRFTSPYWADTSHKMAKLAINFNGWYKLTFDVENQNGERRFLEFTANDTSGGIDQEDPRYINWGLGSFTADGQWNWLLINLEKRLQEAYPNEQIAQINKMFVWGNGSLYKVELTNRDLYYLENVDEGGTNDWVADNENGLISSCFNNENGETKIELHSQDGARHRFTLVDKGKRDFNIANTGYNQLHFSLQTNAYFKMQVKVLTDAGVRFLEFTSDKKHQGDIDGTYLHTALYSHLADNKERYLTLDLEKYLNQWQPGVKLEKILKLYFYTTGTIELGSVVLDNTPSSEVVYVDGLGQITTDGWSVKNDGSVQVVYDDSRGSDVIQLIGDTHEVFTLRNPDGSDLNISGKNIVQWSYKTTAFTKIQYQLEVVDQAGNIEKRFVEYRPSDDEPYLDGRYAIYGIGSDKMSGGWKTIDRDLEADLEALDPGWTINKIVKINIIGPATLEHVSFRDRL